MKALLTAVAFLFATNVFANDAAAPAAAAPAPAPAAAAAPAPAPAAPAKEENKVTKKAKKAHKKEETK